MIGFCWLAAPSLRAIHEELPSGDRSLGEGLQGAAEQKSKHQRFLLVAHEALFACLAPYLLLSQGMIHWAKMLASINGEYNVQKLHDIPHINLMLNTATRSTGTVCAGIGVVGSCCTKAWAKSQPRQLEESAHNLHRPCWLYFR